MATWMELRRVEVFNRQQSTVRTVGTRTKTWSCERVKDKKRRRRYELQHEFAYYSRVRPNHTRLQVFVEHQALSFTACSIYPDQLLWSIRLYASSHPCTAHIKVFVEHRAYSNRHRERGMTYVPIHCENCQGQVSRLDDDLCSLSPVAFLQNANKY